MPKKGEKTPQGPRCDCKVHVPCFCPSPTGCRLCLNDPRHGTSNGYNNLKCRCDRCREANTLYLRVQREKRLAKEIPEHVHGTAGGYGNWGCRCVPCTKAWSADSLDRYQRLQRGETLCQQGLMATPKRRPGKPPSGAENR